MIYPVFRNYRHGHTVKNTRTRSYNSWVAMKQRCYNPEHPGYAETGALGITICPEWIEKKEGFMNFLIDMGEPPVSEKRHGLSRVDLSKPYSKENCEWRSWDKIRKNQRR